MNKFDGKFQNTKGQTAYLENHEQQRVKSLGVYESTPQIVRYNLMSNLTLITKIKGAALKF